MSIQQPTDTIVRGQLHFTKSGNGYVCHELVQLPQMFEQRHSSEDVHGAIKVYMGALRNMFELDYKTKEERDAVPEQERLRLGGIVFDEVVATINLEGLSLFQQFMFWMSDWWYYNTTIRTRCRFNYDRFSRPGEIGRLIKNYVLVLLPQQVCDVVGSMEAVSTAVAFGHFAVLFENRNGVRRIITDTQLFELHDVRGYSYLDITKEGKPVARSVTSRGGERAFFDGVRLMSHNMFQTCAPKTVVIESGYKVNSTKCTIINGTLFPLIETDDAVAKTTGAFMGMVDFTKAQALQSFALSDATGAKLKVDGEHVFLDGQKLKPIGVFDPSSVTLLDSGFSLYHWSSFTERTNCRFSSVLVVDDKQGWADDCRRELGPMVERFDEVVTGDRTYALRAIVERSPEVVLLDMHLTGIEEFDGLWIANQLFEKGFRGRILIASSYPDTHLQAMKILIKGKVWAPGKDIERIRKLLCSSELL